MDFLVPKWCREPLATLSKMDMQVCPLILCNFFQKALAKNKLFISHALKSFLIAKNCFDESR